MPKIASAFVARTALRYLVAISSAMLIRRARSDDAGALAALYRELVPGDANIRVDGAQVAELEHHPSSVLLVCERDAVVRGTAFLTICRDVMYGSQPYGLIENVVVQAGYRSAGIGRALVTELETIARACACTKLMLLSAATRVDAHEFFVRCGFDGVKKRGFVKYLNRV